MNWAAEGNLSARIINHPCHIIDHHCYILDIMSILAERCTCRNHNRTDKIETATPNAAPSRTNDQHTDVAF